MYLTPSAFGRPTVNVVGYVVIYRLGENPSNVLNIVLNVDTSARICSN